MNEEIDISALARKLKRVYEAFRSRTSPGFKASRTYDSDWFNLANHVINLGACPVVYLESVFEDWGTGVPYINTLRSNKATNIYLRYMELGKSVGHLEFTNQIRYLNDCLSAYGKKYGDVDNILDLDFLPLKAYIRILLCSEIVLSIFLKKYGLTAMAELKSNPSINKYIKENYVSRYNRLLPQRLPESDSSAHDPLPPPSKANSRGVNIPKRRRPTNPPGNIPGS